MSGRVLFFGKLRDVAGVAEMPMPPSAPGGRLSALTRLVTSSHPTLLEALSHPSVRVAVDLEIVERGADPELGPHSEVAYMPPMSGG